MTDCGSPKAISYVWTEGDTEPEINFVLPGGKLVADYVVTMRLERPDGAVVQTVATDDGGSLGHFAWDAADLIAGANQRAQIDRVLGGAVVSSKLFLLNVIEKVAP